MTAQDSPVFVSHTVRLSRADVLEALRAAALARAGSRLALADAAARGVELDTRVLPGGDVQIDGAVVTIEARLPDQVLAVLRAQVEPRSLRDTPRPEPALIGQG
jgi:hypothetical protein